ncbi:hypothetical protein [Lederbergia lenta]|uniref:hypothetical protein n=1 Tax=Lederbergia lenta TaxID=1467 RepID=UPI00203CF047|nr:hypothetical protein [Lederbergia lenta]MCM3109971.1 hypothetical protein [Lederbergia lenta]
MNSNDIRESFLAVIQEEFPTVVIPKEQIVTSKMVSRISPYVKAKKKKRWMQLDANNNYLSIAMNHFTGDITKEDLKDLGFNYDLNHKNTSIKIQPNNDAINISVFISEPYDFTKKEFVDFLHKHYQSYLKVLQ